MSQRSCPHGNYHICKECGLVQGDFTQMTTNPDNQQPHSQADVDGSIYEDYPPEDNQQPTKGGTFSMPTFLAKKADLKLPQQPDDELNEIINRIETEYRTTPWPTIRLEAKNSLLAWREAAVREAEANAVAWSIDVVDDIHQMNGQVDFDGRLDRVFKGIKNQLRDRFKLKGGSNE